jgi:hypothetical protein
VFVDYEYSANDTQRQAILAATIEMRLEGNDLMCQGMRLHGTSEGVDLYESGRLMHDYAELWASKARSR